MADQPGPDNLKGRLNGAPPTPDSRPLAGGRDSAFHVLAACQQGALEDRLRKTARALELDIAFARGFPEALHALGLRPYDILVVAKAANGMNPREFVHEVRRICPEVVVVIAAPAPEYENLLDAMVEGAYDFLSDDADDHQLRLMLSRAIEHSALHRKTRQLERALEAQTSSLRQRLQELALLNELTRELGSVPDLDEVLRRALARLLEAFGSDCGSFLILDPPSGELVVRAAAGTGAEHIIGLRQPLGKGVAGRVAGDRLPVLVTDIDRDSRFSADARRKGVRRYQSPSFVAVPLVYHGTLLGEINIAEKRSGEPFSPDDLRLLSILASHVASAINGALAAEELKKANDALRHTVVAARMSLQTTNDRLSKAESLAHSIASRLPAAVAAFDLDLRITFANEPAAGLLRLARNDSLKGHPDWSDLAAITAAALNAVEHGTVTNLTSRAQLDQCCSEQCLDIVVAPVRLPDGRIHGGTIVGAAGHCPLIHSIQTEEKTP